MSKVIACTWHDCPSPMYPSVQVQLWEPLVSVHFAFTSQTWILSLHSSTSIIKSVRYDDDQSDGHEDDFGWWWWFVVNDVSDDLFWFNLFLSDNQKYLHNIVLDLFPFASDTSVWHNPTVMLHSSITSLL